MISVENLKVEFSIEPLFEDVNFVVNDKERVCLVGKNGAGKSTLLKIIAGLQHPTAGSVAMPQGSSVGYLPQVMKLTDNCTLIEETEKAFASLHDKELRLERINAELAQRTDYESDDYASLIERSTSLQEQLQMSGSQNRGADIERTLMGLGFERKDLHRPTSEFSGGWRMRIELAKILLQRPDVLLLDEPTNHLDIESIQWLESFLKNRNGALLLVSHDRAFIDNVTNRTIEISLGKIYDYKVSYSQFVDLRKERVEQQ
ncbi:MAG: ABC-F family ATP-binding cassette domain-containing protein, partial [Bacteroidaceae bacterium]|nr:ABC-F family ATP-binding cassette domain-containing protein [Bacteroidaceae bacterium]